MQKIRSALASAIAGFAGLMLMLFANPAGADVGLGLRAGTMGGGLDLNVGMGEHLSLRLGYNYFNYDETLDDTDIRYDGTLKISSLSGMLDWYPFGGGFRLSVGAVASGPKIEAVGVPTSGGFEIGGTFYPSAAVSSVTGEIKIGNSVAPYVGIGYGNVVGKNHRVTFLFDLGAVYGGTPDVTLTANCSSSLTTTQCNTLQTQLQADVAQEIADLQDQTSAIKWYPVVNIGLGIRF